MIPFPRYLPDQNALAVWGVRDPYPAGSLVAARQGDLLAVLSPVTGETICAWIRFDQWTLPDGTALPDAASAFAVLDAACRQKRLVGSPLRTVAVQIAVAGQTLIPVNPAPVDVNSILMLVNGIAYVAPRAFGFSPARAVLTWLGLFDLLPEDEIILRYT